MEPTTDNTQQPQQAQPYGYPQEPQPQQFHANGAPNQYPQQQQQPHMYGQAPLPMYGQPQQQPMYGAQQPPPQQPALYGQAPPQQQVGMPGQPIQPQNPAMVPVAVQPQVPVAVEKPEEVHETSTGWTMERTKSTGAKVGYIVFGLMMLIVFVAINMIMEGTPVYGIMGGVLVCGGIGFQMVITPQHKVELLKGARTISVTRTNMIGSVVNGFSHTINIADVTGIAVKEIWRGGSRGGSSHVSNNVILHTRSHNQVEIMATQTGRPGRNGMCGGDPLEYAEQHMHFWANVLNANGGAVQILPSQK